MKAKQTRRAQTQKERNTQRRKRRKGLFHKAYQLGKLYGLDVAVFIHNPDDGQYHTFRSTDQ